MCIVIIKKEIKKADITRAKDEGYFYYSEFYIFGEYNIHVIPCINSTRVAVKLEEIINKTNKKEYSIYKSLKVVDIY